MRTAIVMTATGYLLLFLLFILPANSRGKKSFLEDYSKNPSHQVVEKVYENLSEQLKITLWSFVGMYGVCIASALLVGRGEQESRDDSGFAGHSLPFVEKSELYQGDFVEVFQTTDPSDLLTVKLAFDEEQIPSNFSGDCPLANEPGLLARFFVPLGFKNRAEEVLRSLNLTARGLGSDQPS